MKKYITVAALLAAGTAFANAEEVVCFDITLNDSAITFDETNERISLTYTGWSYAGNGNRDTNGWQSPSNANYRNTFSPDAQLQANTADAWTLNFTLVNNGSEDIILTGFTFDAYGINGGGSDKSAAIPVTTTLGIASDTYENQTESYSLGYGGATSKSTFGFGSGITLAAGDSLDLSFTMGNAKSYNTYAGLTGGTLTYSIPEPSAFGMLAGLGALALVASRRRRR